MGVLYDYYRAADRAAATVRPDEGRLERQPGEFDGVGVKNIDYAVVLGRLIGFILDVPWTVDLVQETLLYWDEPDGALIVELSGSFRDALAGVDDARLPVLGQRWAGIEEFGPRHPEGDDLVPLIRDFVDLARRAQAAGELLYCWSIA